MKALDVMTSIVFLALSPLALCQDRFETRLLVCAMQLGKYSSKIEVTETGKASLSIQDQRSPRSTHCPLQIRRFNYASRAVVPHVEFEFSRLACDPARSELHEQELLKTITLIIDESDPRKKPAGLVQWLRHSQTMACQLKTFESEELKRDAAMWLEKKWGRH